MKKEPKFVAISNQKGGVGKSAMTVLLASFVHYSRNKNVLVVDCDFPQHSIKLMRDRDVMVVSKNDYYKKMMVAQFSEIKKKAYTILSSSPDKALETANAFLDTTELDYDIIFFDLPGTVNTAGVFNSLINMDYIFTPVVSDQMAMKSSISFATSLQDFITIHKEAPLKGFYLFWNMIDNRVSKDVYNAYNKIIRQLNLNLLQTVMPHTHRYSKELSETSRVFFRCTLFPPSNPLLQGSKLDELADEILTIVKLK